MAFLQEKKFDNLVEAVLDGSVDPRRLKVDMLDLVVREIRRRQHESAKDERKEARQAARAALGPPSFSGQTCMVEGALVASLGEPFLTALAQQYPTATRVWDCATATCFIVADVTAIAKSIAWAAGLRGAAVMDMEHAASDGSGGICQQLDNYNSRRRAVHMIDAFCLHFPTLSALIRRCSPDWVHISEDVLLDTVSRYHGARAAELLVLGTAHEVLQRAVVRPEFHGIKYFFTENMGRQLVQNVNRDRSSGDVARGAMQ